MCYRTERALRLPQQKRRQDDDPCILQGVWQIEAKGVTTAPLTCTSPDCVVTGTCMRRSHIKTVRGKGGMLDSDLVEST